MRPNPRPSSAPTPPTALDQVQTVPRAYAGQRLPAPSLARPRVVVDIDEAVEREVIAENGGPALVAYGNFDPSLPPVVLVHGMDGHPGHLRTIADRLRREGKQVYFFCYDDRRATAEDSGRALASSLVDLRRRYGENTRLDLVAHSFGGIVTRAALSSLANPRWLDGTITDAANPRAGFSAVRVRTLDTPWQGYGSTWPQIPILTTIFMAIVHFFFWLVGQNAAWGMRSNSELLTHLHDTKLAGVDFENIAAHQAENERDQIRALEDFDLKERSAVIRYLQDGTLPGSPRAKNWCLMLADDSRLDALRSAVRRAPSPDTLVATVESVMPSVSGTHMSILEDRAVIDRVATELR